MEDQMIHVDKEQESISDADLARKLLKKEQRLFARLQETQEAEARALERFRRVQARLQRRGDRLERIKSHLLLVQKQIADLQIADQQPEHVEPVLAMSATSEPTPIADSEETAPATTEPELVATPDSTTVAVPATTEPELVAPSDSATVAVPATTEPELVAPPDSATVAVPATTEPEAISLPATELAVPTTIEPEVDATPGVDTSSGSTEEREPTKPLLSGQETQPTAVSLPQDISSAKEAWVAAESAMQNARNTAHGLAASISFLSQTGGLSNELVAELLRKQSEANKALLKAQNAARFAYEKYIQAQEDADRAASQPVDESMSTPVDHMQQNQENGTLPTEENNVAGQTVQMRSLPLYKAW
jgi:hypothetical protein